MKRSLPCELHVGGEVHPATTIEVHERRLVVQCDANLAMGTELDVRIPALAEIEELWLQVRVARSSTRGSRQVSFEVREAPSVYQVLTMPGLEIELPAGTRSPTLTRGPTPRAVVLLDAGDLEPVAELLDDLGVEYTHVKAQRKRVDGWPAPTRIFIASARLVLALPMPPLAEDDDVMGIAVADAATQTVVQNVQRMGFRHLVSQPFHRDALAFMLRQALYQDRTTRAAPRYAVGVGVSWRSGLRRHKATLIELSTSGCRLHTRRPLAEGAAVRFAIPARAGSDGPLKLRARVVRQERRRGNGLREPYMAGLRWEELDDLDTASLELLVAARAIGPVPLEPGDECGAPVDEAAVGVRGRRSGRSPDDRRRGPRALLHGEVITLDASDAVEHVLVCRDVSEGGMRIDPHPGLEIGQTLRVAVNDPGDPSPITLEAEVVRDAADAGLGLEFVNVSPESRERLAALVERLPKVHTRKPRSRRVVFGRVVERD